MTHRATVFRRAFLAFVLTACAGACGDAGPGQIVDPPSACGPSTALVLRVVDGDTLVLAAPATPGGGGDDRTGAEFKVRVIGIDTPELHPSPECYANEAAAYTRELVELQMVELTYDAASQCLDRYGRTLAYVTAPDGDLGELLVSRGFACAYYVPPVGEDRADALAELELRAREQGRGLWGACPGDLRPDCAR